MAWTRADLATLDGAIKSGVLSVRYGDRTVQYQSMGDLMEARRLILAEVEKAEGVKPTPRARFFRVFQSGRGY